MILIAKYPALAKKNIDKINNTVLTISFILVLYRWVCYTLVKRRAFAPLRYFSSLSRISRIIPTIKSLSSSASQAFNLLSDFFFFRLSPLICISPPYIIYYIIRYTVCQQYNEKVPIVFWWVLFEGECQLMTKLEQNDSNPRHTD